MPNELLLAQAADAARPSSIELDADASCVLAAAGVRPELERFISAHRREGHRYAALDPLGAARPLDLQGLSPARFGLAAADAVTTDGRAWLGARQVHELDLRLKAAYCGPLALD